MGNFITSIDFGSFKTVVAVGQKRDDGIHIVFWESAPSKGIKYGEVMNITKCSEVLKELLNHAQTAIGEPIREASVSICGRKIESREEKIEINRTSPNSAISYRELKELTESQYKKCDANSVVLDVIPQQYNIDEDYNVDFSEIEGMRGQVIDAQFRIFSGKKMLVESREQVLKECGVSMKKCILTPIASARGILTEQEREKGVVLIDMGKDLTEISIVRNNVVRDAMVLPFAGESITKDIVNETDVSQFWAETVKVRHGYCLEEACPENKILSLINNDGDAEGEIDLMLMTRVIEARVSEIFDAVKYLASKNKYANKLNGGYVLTGGSAYLGYILPLAKTILGGKVRLAAPRGYITEDSETGAYDAGSSVSVGVILEQNEPLLSTAPESIRQTFQKVSFEEELDIDDGELETPTEKEKTSKGLLSILKKTPPVKGNGSKGKEKKKPDNGPDLFGGFFSDEGNGNNA